MDKDLDCCKKMIARLDLRINKLLKMRKNITLDMMYLITSEENKKIPPTTDKQTPNAFDCKDPHTTKTFKYVKAIIDNIVEP